MRSEFDEWYEKWTGSKVKCENYDVLGAWKHQQSKVDELQEKLDASEKTRSTLYEENVDLRAKNDDMQKRVDAAQKLIQQWRDVETYSDDCANELEQALKGGEHEN